MLKPEYSKITRSILWLFMPRLLMSPGHQQPQAINWTSGDILSIRPSRSYSNEICVWNSNIFNDENIFQNALCKVLPAFFRPQCVSSLWPSDTIWRHRSGSTLVQVMARCRQAPSHYLNQCCLLINELLWHSPESNVSASAQSTEFILWN